MSLFSSNFQQVIDMWMSNIVWSRKRSTWKRSGGYAAVIAVVKFASAQCRGGLALVKLCPRTTYAKRAKLHFSERVKRFGCASARVAGAVRVLHARSCIVWKKWKSSARENSRRNVYFIGKFPGDFQPFQQLWAGITKFGSWNWNKVEGGDRRRRFCSREPKFPFGGCNGSVAGLVCYSCRKLSVAKLVCSKSDTIEARLRKDS